MISMAIVDDNREDAELLKRYIEYYAQQYGCQLHVTVYTSGVNFLEYYKPVDVVFMDIQMPSPRPVKQTIPFMDMA